MDRIVRVKVPLLPEQLVYLQSLNCDGPYDANAQDAYFFASSRYEETLKALPYVLEVKPVPQVIKQTVTKTIHLRAAIQ